MKIEEQVLTIDQMQHLKELGVEVKDTALSWTKYPVYELNGNLGWRLRVVMSEDGTLCKDGLIPTFTISDILGLLPSKIEIGPNFSKYQLEIYTDSHIIRYATGSGRELQREVFHENILNASYNMLCWVAENGYLKKE